MIKKNAYSLIEVLVAISVFTIVIAAPTGFLVGSIKGQQKALSSQKLIDNVSYSLEYISRALRMAKKDRDGTCIEKGSNFEIKEILDTGISGLMFKDYDNICRGFFVQENRLMEYRKGTSPSILPLTSNKLEIISLNFNLIGQFQTDNLQPRVTLALDIKGVKSKKPELQPKLKIQTTISQRNLDVQYE